MKKLVFGILATLLSMSVADAQTIADLQKSRNPHNNDGERFYHYFQDKIEAFGAGKISKDDISKAFRNNEYLESERLSEEQVEVYKTYFSDREINVENLITFENYILDTLKTNDIKLLQSVAILKWGLMVAHRRTVGQAVSAFESCLDRCMYNSMHAVFVQGNWVVQAAFISQVHYSLAWAVGSCTWDCL